MDQLDPLKYLAQHNGEKIKDTIYHQEKKSTNLEVLLSTNKKAIAYGSCNVLADQDQEVLLFINVDDKIRLWVNDDPVISIQYHTKDGAVPKRSRLKKGINRIFIEIENISRDWWFDIAILAGKRTREIVSSMNISVPQNVLTEGDGPRTQLMNWRVIGPLKSKLEDINEFELLKAGPYVNGQYIVDTVYHQGKPGNSLYELFNTTEENRIAYATCIVFSDKDRDVVLDVRVDDELRLWIDNKEILQSPADRVAIKKVNFKKGVNKVIAEIRNQYRDWWFEIAVSGVDYVRDNMLLPGYNQSSVNPVIAEGDSLSIGVVDTNFIPVKHASKIEIFDAGNKLVYTGQIDIGKSEKLSLAGFPSGAYKYNLYTDLDTLSEYFCYGPLDTLYNKESLLKNSQHSPTAYRSLLPYIKRFDRLLNDYKTGPNVLLNKKIAFCLYKIKEIETAAQKRNTDYLRSSGLNLRSFSSVIDHGDEHYLLYVPEKMIKSGKAMPLVVMVPFVTNNHPFYTGAIIANYSRIAYLSRFADRYGFAIIFPSSRIYKWYNQTHITTRAITEAIHDAGKYYHFDKERIFLYGECSGSLFALQTAIRRPDLFAAIGLRGPELSTINMDGYDASGQVSNNIYSLIDNLQGKPIFVLHSKLDHAARIDFTNDLVDYMQKNGCAVTYNSLQGLIKDYDMTSYTEPEVINATFSFFSNVKRSGPTVTKKIATYGFYNDTLYGFFVKEKLLPGKATISYQVKTNKLELTTTNVRKLAIDKRKISFENPSKMEIYHNGKQCFKNVDYRISSNMIELTCVQKSDNKGKGIAKEVYGPLNKVFLNTFAVVRPGKATVKNNFLIAAIDSIWFDEYRNHILIVNERSVDSAQKAGLNLVYILDSIYQVPKPVLRFAGIELKTDTLIIDSENYVHPEFSFAFYHKNENNRDSMFLGAGSDSIPFDMLKNLFTRAGWNDFELWDGDMPFFQKSYE